MGTLWGSSEMRRRREPDPAANPRQHALTGALRCYDDDPRRHPLRPKCQRIAVVACGLTRLCATCDPMCSSVGKATARAVTKPGHLRSLATSSQVLCSHGDSDLSGICVAGDRNIGPKNAHEPVGNCMKRFHGVRVVDEGCDLHRQPPANRTLFERPRRRDKTGVLSLRGPRSVGPTSGSSPWWLIDDAPAGLW
jgi:hypothetical protein